MNDIIAITLVLGFFGLAALYVVWCERILAGEAPDGFRVDRADAATESVTEDRIPTGSPS